MARFRLIGMLTCWQIKKIYFYIKDYTSRILYLDCLCTTININLVMLEWDLKFYADIGANLVDDMYQGLYNGSKKHEPDLDRVLQRAFSNGLQKIFVTAGNLEESQNAVKLVQQVDSQGQGSDSCCMFLLSCIVERTATA